MAMSNMNGAWFNGRALVHGLNQLYCMHGFYSQQLLLSCFPLHDVQEYLLVVLLSS